MVARAVRAALFRFALPALAAVALWPAAQDARDRLRAPSPSPRPEDLARFTPFRAHLAGIPLVSYLCDPADFATLEQGLADPAAAARAQRAQLDAFLAQRVLAPTLVRPLEQDTVWTLVNYHDRARVPDDWRQRGLEMVADPGTGAVLFRLKGK